MMSLKAVSAVLVFLSFALAYFLSNVVRAITATISPNLQVDFALSAGDLGLLAGGYFLGFAAMQIPMGIWLDQWGAKKVLLLSLCLALLGLIAFALAVSFQQLLFARVLIGVGVSACLMAPMAAYRCWFEPATQLRCSSWMLMTGALGMLASTLPIQWALPFLGWRGVFMALAILCALVILAIVFGVPQTTPDRRENSSQAGGYWIVLKNPYFQSLAPMAFFFYGGYMAMQTLWIGPWLTEVLGQSPEQAAAGLFGLNVVMLLTFLFWGWSITHFKALGIHADTLIQVFAPMCLGVAVLIAIFATDSQWWWWALYLVFASALSFAQPTLALQFDEHLVGRALTSFNLLIFAGGFFMQWCFGLVVDALKNWGFSVLFAYQGALCGLIFFSSLAFFWFVCGVRQSRIRTI